MICLINNQLFIERLVQPFGISVSLYPFKFKFNV